MDPHLNKLSRLTLWSASSSFSRALCSNRSYDRLIWIEDSDMILQIYVIIAY